MPVRKRKKRVRLGLCEDRYHRLFLDRLNREGRADAFYKRRSELYHSDDWKLFWDNTWWPIAREFGFESKEDEIERYEDYMLHGSRTKMEIELEQMKKEIARENRENLVDELPDVKNLELPPDIAWVYAHPAMLRRPNKSGFVDLEDQDFTSAPNSGAAGMLQFFVDNKRDFYRMVLTHLSKKDTATTDDRAFEDDLRDVKEIESMLQNI